MRIVLKLLAVGCLFFLTCSTPVSADDEPRQYDARFWIKASTEQRYTDRVSLTSYQGQCRWQSEWMPDPVFNTCITYTQWGSINQNGMSLTASNHKPLELADGQQLLASPDSRRLYISQSAGNGFIKVGYLEKPSEDIVFDTETSKYKLRDGMVFQFLPTLYKNVASANNSYYIVGQANDGTLVRTALTDFSTKKFVGKSPAFNIADTRHWAISTHGTLVVGSNANNEVIAYELGYCDNRSNAADECTTKQIGHSQEMIVESAGIYINDEASHINLYSRLFGRVMSRVSYSFDAESLNRHVTYVALGDSFSSGEGAWSYDNKTDGDNGFSQEKCHQSYSAYPQRYASKHTRWDDEYYEPNLQGDMVIMQDDYRSLACSGATSNDIQAFDNKYKTNPVIQNAFLGQFGQFDNWLDERKYNSIADAIANDIPGRAHQIKFLEKYKPTIATLGIGGNDIGFSGSLEACISSVKTCPQASSKKTSEGVKIRDEFKLLNALYKEVQRASPNTRYFAVGYPKIIVNDDYVCGPNVLLDAWEREYIKKSTEYLNQVIKAAAAKNGFGYIDFENAIGSQGLCGSEIGVNGLSFGNDKKEITLLGKKYALFANESYHPTSYGQGLLADKIVDSYGELDVIDYPTCTKNSEGICSKASIQAPSIPSYFGMPNNDRTVFYKNFTSTVTSGSMPIQIANFLRNSRVKITIFSEPYSLGNFVTDSTGGLSQNISLPSFIEPGYHTLYLEGTNDDGEAVEYQQVFLYLPEDTKLGPCSFLPYSSLDQDADGIDDACDPEISVENPLTFADPSEYLTYPNPERPRPIIVEPQDPNPEPGQPTATTILAKPRETTRTPISAVLGAVANPADIFAASTPSIQPATSAATGTPETSKSPAHEPAKISRDNYGLYVSAIVVLISATLLVYIYFGKKV